MEVCIFDPKLATELGMNLRDEPVLGHVPGDKALIAKHQTRLSRYLLSFDIALVLLRNIRESREPRNQTTKLTSSTCS